MRARQNVLITGGTGTGKTTMLAALLAHVPHDERIVTIEDVAELHPRHPHHVSLEARQPNLEGVGAISVARLVRESLRMRPDRLIVGECRGEEIRDLLTALNTGHDGGAGTLHASGLADVPARLEALGALAGMDPPALARQAVSAFALRAAPGAGAVGDPPARAGRCAAAGRRAPRDRGGAAVVRGGPGRRRSRAAAAPSEAEVAERVRTLAVLLQAGAAPSAAWRHLAESGAAEASAVVAELDRGRDLVEAVRDQGGVWTTVAAAWRIGATVGAPLGEVLRAIAAALEGAGDIRDEVEVALAEPAGTARLMLWLPLVGLLLGTALGFDTVTVLTTQPAGWVCLAAGVALLLLARMWTGALVRRARPSAEIPGIRAELLVVALTGGTAIPRALRLVAEETGRGRSGQDGRAAIGEPTPRVMPPRTTPSSGCCGSPRPRACPPWNCFAPRRSEPGARPAPPGGRVPRGCPPVCCCRSAPAPCRRSCCSASPR